MTDCAYLLIQEAFLYNLIEAGTKIENYMDLVHKTACLGLHLCQRFLPHHRHQGKIVLQRIMKHRFVFDVEQNLDLVTGSAENAGRTLNVSRAFEHLIEFEIRFLFKYLQLVLSKIENIAFKWYLTLILSKIENAKFN